MPVISIIVPIYNVEQYLHKCIDSILAQTFKDFELILINDGSTDNCRLICEEYIKKDKRIKLINKTNGGLSDARNTGLQIVKGDYIGFVDSDDWIEPEMYETLYNLCQENEADIGICSFNLPNREGKGNIRNASDTIMILDSLTAIKYMYDGKLTGFSACNKLFKKNTFEHIRFPKGRAYEDAAIMYRVYNGVKKIAFIDYPFYNYFIRESSITRSQFSEKRFDIVLNYQETKRYMEKNLPEMSEKLDSIFFETLRNMVVDIINEKSVIKNYKYIGRISEIIRKYNSRIKMNNLISIRHKILAQILAWCPIVGIFFYKLRILHRN